MAELQLCYTVSALAREVNLDRRKLARMLKRAGILLRKGKIWICDIRLHLPELLDSWDELKHQKKMAQGNYDDEEDPY